MVWTGLQTPLTITLSLRNSSSSSNTRFTFVPCTFNCQVLVASTTHISDNRAAQVLSQRNPLLPRLRFVPQKKKGVWGSVEVSCGDRNARQPVSNWGPGRVTPIRRGTPVSSSWCNSLVGTFESRFKRYLHYVGWIIRLEPSAWKLQSPPLTLLLLWVQQANLPMLSPWKIIEIHVSPSAGDPTSWCILQIFWCSPWIMWIGKCDLGNIRRGLNSFCHLCVVQISWYSPGSQ